MVWSTSVLTSLTSDTQPSILVNFENAKYLFNVGENTNRSVLQSRQNLKRARGVFLTGCDTDRAGGLTGSLMSLSDANIASLTVAGPPGIKHHIAAMRSFTFRDSMTVTPLESKPTDDPDKPLYKDEIVQIFAAPILPTPSSTCGASLETEPDSLKRKLPSSFEESDADAKRRMPETSGQEKSLQELMREADFQPASLSGDLAEEYRSTIIRSMFGPSKSHGKNGKDADSIDNYWQRPPLPAGFFLPLPKLTPPSSQYKLAYAIVGPRIRGKFDVKRAEELGVPYGRLRGQLTKGQTVTFTTTVKVMGEDGEERTESVERTVRPEECVAAAAPPGVVVVLDIPTREHIPSLQATFDTGQFRRLRSDKAEDTEEYDLRVVYHLLGPGVLEDPAYLQFMNGFSAKVHHIVSAPEYSRDPITFTSAASNQLKLHQLDPTMFPIPHFSLQAPKPISDLTNLPALFQPLESGLVTLIKPYKPPHTDPIIAELDLFHPRAVPFLEEGKPLQLSENSQKLFGVAKQLASELPAPSTPRPGDEITVCPLGTASALPTKYRNVSSILVQTPGYGNILLDAGEGTYGQLCRLFGNGLEDVLRGLNCIFISHIHADHHAGLAKILARRQKLNIQSPLYLIAPRAIHLYLREWEDLFDLGINDDEDRPTGVKSIMSESVHALKPDMYMQRGRWGIGGDESWTDIHRCQKYASDMMKTLGLRDFITVSVEHRVKAYGAVIKFEDGSSLVYSGDTTPSNNLVRDGQGATLLIHEATMADEEADLAKVKAHSTVGQALRVGTQMRAENLLLTHFSARYPKTPPQVSASGNRHNRDVPTTGLAFDLSRIRIGDMKKLSAYVDAMKQCVDDTGDEEGDTGDEEAELAGKVDDRG